MRAYPRAARTASVAQCGYLAARKSEWSSRRYEGRKPIWTIRDGKVVRGWESLAMDEALRAAGLEWSRAAVRCEPEVGDRRHECFLIGCERVGEDCRE